MKMNNYQLTTIKARFYPPAGGAACPYLGLLGMAGSLRSLYIAAIRAVCFTAGLQVKGFFRLARRFLLRANKIGAGSAPCRRAIAGEKLAGRAESICHAIGEFFY